MTRSSARYIRLHFMTSHHIISHCVASHCITLHCDTSYVFIFNDELEREVCRRGRWWCRSGGGIFGACARDDDGVPPCARDKQTKPKPLRCDERRVCYLGEDLIVDNDSRITHTRKDERDE